MCSYGQTGEEEEARNLRVVAWVTVYKPARTWVSGQLAASKVLYIYVPPPLLGKQTIRPFLFMRDGLIQRENGLVTLALPQAWKPRSQ